MQTNCTYMRPKIAKSHSPITKVLSWCAGGTIAISLLVPQNACGIANWARKYGVDCLTCHAPAAPRLNSFGHQFRKMGYRMDTEIEKGKPDAYKELGEFASVRFRTGYRIEHFELRGW